MSLFRLSRVTIDSDQRMLEFKDAIRSKSFWNVLPMRLYQCQFSDLTNVKTYAESGYRCLLVETADAKSVFLDTDVSDFEEFADHFLDIWRQITDSTISAND